VRPQIGFHLDKCPTAETYAGENVEAGFVLEIPKIDLAPLQSLMDEVKTGSRTDIRRPPAVPEVDGQTVGTLQINSEHIRELSEAELCIGTKVEVAAEDRTNPCVYSNQEQFRIQAAAKSDANLPSPQFLLDLTFHLAHLFRGVARRRAGQLRVRALAGLPIP
jgi:hypothetical protein